MISDNDQLSSREQFQMNNKLSSHAG